MTRVSVTDKEQRILNLMLIDAVLGLDVKYVFSSEAQAKRVFEAARKEFT